MRNILPDDMDAALALILIIGVAIIAGVTSGLVVSAAVC